MFNLGLIAVVILSIAMALVIGALAFFSAGGKKRNWFILMTLCTAVYLVGQLQEYISVDAGGAFAGVRFLYIGSQFIGPCALFFAADYSEVKTNRWIKGAILTVSLCCVIMLWTTDKTQLVYKEFWLDTSGVHSFEFVAAPGYTFIYAYSLALTLASLIIILRRMRVCDRERRKPLRLLAIVLALPIAVAVINYLLNVFYEDLPNVNLTPYALLLSNSLLFFGVVRYDIVEINSAAIDRVIDLIAEAYVLIDEKRRFITANNAAKVMFPALRTFKGREHIDELEGWPDALRVSVDGEGRSIEYELERADGAPRQIFVAEINRVQVSLVGIHTAWLFLIRDVTQSRLVLRELEEYAYRDPLTELNNRRHFLELVQPAISKSKRLRGTYFVLMLDLDHFKFVNDRYGHLAGDETLRQCAAVIKRTIRAYDIVGRYGGEEFIVFIEDAMPSEALQLAERIRVNIENALIAYSDHEIKITISIGVARQQTGLDFEAVVDEADKALYIAKRDRNKVFFIEDAAGS